MPENLNVDNQNQNNTTPNASTNNQPANPTPNQQNSATQNSDVQIPENNQNPITGFKENPPVTQGYNDSNKINLIKQQKEKKKQKKLFLGCISIFVVLILFFVIAIILFMAQAKAGQTNPLLSIFGIKEANLIGALKTLSNFGFGLFTFASFIITIIGLFKLLIVRKDDIRGKRSGIITLIVGMIFFTTLIFSWIAAYLYLSKIQPVQNEENRPLSAYIITDPADLTNLKAPVTVQFDASNIPRAEKSSILWDFGDNTSGNGVEISHTYKTIPQNKDGKYTVKLTINNFLDGEVKKQEATLDVIISNILPEAKMKLSESEGEIPLEIKFDASESKDPDGEIVAYDWEFNEDDSFDDAEGKKTTYTYDKSGSYVAKLRITDNNGDFKIIEEKIKALSPEKPVAVISSNNKQTKYYVGVNYIFDASDSDSPFGKIIKYQWDMGDGSTFNTKSVSHSFEDSGNYSVKLKVTDETGETGENTVKIDVQDKDAAPQAKIKTSPEITDKNNKKLVGAVPFKVFFDASDSKDQDNNIVDYRWDFDGDGSIDKTGREVSYTFEEIGKYNATLFITDADDNQDQTTLIVQVEEKGITADLKASAITGEVPLEITFDASGSAYPGGDIISYEWDFGNGIKKMGNASITYTYTEIGEFTAKVTAIASDGLKTTAETNLIVRPVSLKACFEPSKKEGEAPLKVTFNPSCSRGSIAKYLWDFQGSTSTDKKPTYTFKNPGTYKVKLKVTDYDQVSDEFTYTIVVKGDIDE